MRATFTIGAAVGLTLGTSAPSLGQVELITNGGFETGTIAGWTEFSQSGSAANSNFYIDDDGSPPVSGINTAGPASGTFYAVSDQGGPGANVLGQTVAVPLDAVSVNLSFSMFVNDADSGPIIDPAGLDFTASPNQHARVDLLTLAGYLADPFTTDPSDIVRNFYLSVDPQASNPNPYTPYVFDITADVTPGTSYVVRFGEVDTQGQLNQGVDDVSVSAVIPEPASAAVLGIGTLMLMRRRAGHRHIK